MKQPFTFKQFQIEDLARAAMHDGAIVSWEPGLGKTLAGLAWALAKQAQRVLIVAPGGLHKQWRDEAWAKFGLHVTRLPDVRAFRGLGLDRPLRNGPAPDGRNAPKFCITTYQDLGYNHADEWPDSVSEDGLRETRADRVKARMLDPQFVRVQQIVAALNGGKFDPTPYFEGIGEERNGIRCVWKPTLARVIAASAGCGNGSGTSAGFDCVIVDEGTRLQANESHIGLGVRMLAPKYRLVLTGTPIKNRLESFFWLAHWACGGSDLPTARWPYEGTSEAREDFANQHLQNDRFLTREDEARARDPRVKPRKHEKRSARICNIHRLWKLIAPIVIRRRKTDCGEDIMPKTIKPIHIQPGTAQQAVYRFHLDNPPIMAKNGRSSRTKLDPRARIGMQLASLRQAALCPDAQALGEVIVDPHAKGPRRSWTDANPKQAAILSLVADLLDRGEQVVVGSPFRAFSDALHRRLGEAGVSSVLLDGHTSQEKRGELAAAFKTKRFSVMVAGLNAMGEGHSFECCAHLILPSLSWAYDENEQFLHRIWRLNSPRPVTIYTMVMRNTIDERLAQLFADKGDSAQLALDGRLTDDHVEPVDLAALLADAVRGFDPKAATVDEQAIEAQWPGLRARLGFAELRFPEWDPPIVGGAVTPGEVLNAVNALALPSPSALSVALHRMRNKQRRAAR